MIHAVFTSRGQELFRVEVRGHAGYAEYGADVVCAAVTSALQLTCNAVTEILKAPAKVSQEENKICLELSPSAGPEAVRFLEALRLHLQVLCEDYGDYLVVEERASDLK